MQKTQLLISLLLIFACNFIFSKSWAWENTRTHKDLTTYAVDQSLLASVNKVTLEKFGFSQRLDEVLLWDQHICDDRSGKTICSFNPIFKTAGNNLLEQKWETMPVYIIYYF